MFKTFITAIAILAICPGVLPASELGESPFRTGCAQIFVTEDIEKNLEKYLDFIGRAEEAGVQLLVFPEASLSGYGPRHYRRKPMPPAEVLLNALDRVKEAARQAGIWVVAGTSTWRDDGVYNEIILIDDTGEERGSYAKVQLTKGERKWPYQPGQSLDVQTAGKMKYGMQICFDIRFPEPWRVLALNGAKVIFHAAQACGNHSWKIPVWEGHLRSRAAENGVWVVSCNAAGPVQMGKSYIVDSDGLLVAESNQDHEEMITGMVDLGKRWRTNAVSRRTDLYRLLPADNAEPQDDKRPAQQ